MPDTDREFASSIALATRSAMPVAESLFRELAIRTADGEGVTRDSYGKGEQIAHDLLAAAAERIGLEVDRDPAGNLYMTLPGADRHAPAWFVGSHLDSVLHGGNFDGAAGVVAGVTALAALKDIGLRPPRDITVMGTRAEECSTWFVGHHGGHLGSRAALGLLWPGEMDTAVHVHSGRTFAQCMDDAGFDSSYFRESHPPVLSPRTVHGYLEVHIEQGPVLHERGYPVGVVTGIRGCLRARSARTTGVYTHSGAVPQDMRRDAVLATAELVLAIENECRRRLDSGQDIVFAAGKFHTDAEHHSIVKVPGDVRFALDIRSQDQTVLDDMRVVVDDLVAEINRRRRVTIDLGDVSLVTPATMDPGYMRHMRDGCAVLDIPFMDIPSGAGHDAADFHDAGIPAGMIFIRNDNGSHNPREAMEIDDFTRATELLAWTLATIDRKA